MTLDIHHLTYCLNHHPLIEDISLTFTSGILYGILGPNGSGKSTLLKTLAGIWRPTVGQVFWQGQNLLQCSRIAMSQILSLVPQTPPLYFDFNVYSMVAMGRYPYGCRTPEAHYKIEQALHQVDAWHLRSQLLSQLSGGERQRIYIARALATQAPILLLDEPTSYLDLRHQLEIWQLLRSLVKEGKLIIVAVHDLLAAQRFCDQLVILNQGHCHAIGKYGDIMTPSLLKEVFGVCAHERPGNFELIPFPRNKIPRNKIRFEL
jgi:ABC-type cobalamin/Fe3+-siderophores transport system ATPase subunit